MSKLIGASQPFGRTRPLSYLMRADRYTGRVLYVTFRTDVDLGAWVPPPLVPVDPHMAFLKIYELKRRPETGPPLPPGFSQYREVCVTVLAAPPGDIPRHYNLFMWVDHDWAMYKAREALGWPKKLADIQLTATFPAAGHYDADADIATHRTDVSRWGYRILGVEATLDPATPATQSPPFNGFYTVRHLPAPIGGDPVNELLVIEPRDGWFGTGIYGTATIEFADAPDEELAALGTPEVTSAVLRDVGWVLPAWPARLHSKIDPIDTDMGSAPGKEPA